MLDQVEPTTLGKLAYTHALSLRLSDHDYRRLRKFVAMQEERSERRLTHQAVLEAALRQFLDQNGGP